jgi:hypothetical protein
MQKFWIVVLMLVFIVTHAQGQASPKSSGQYFPDSSLDARGDGFKSHWYSSQLRALQEPSLFQLAKSPSAESYRFLWLRSFHHCVAIRLDPKPDETSVLTTKVADGAGGYRPGTLSENSTRLLTREETQAFISRVDKLGFWKAPNPVNDQSGTDGSQGIIDGVKGGQYHVVDRWTPGEGVVRQLGLMLAFDLAKMNIPKDEIY